MQLVNLEGLDNYGEIRESFRRLLLELKLLGANSNLERNIDDFINNRFKFSHQYNSKENISSFQSGILILSGLGLTHVPITSLIELDKQVRIVCLILLDNDIIELPHMSSSLVRNIFPKLKQLTLNKNKISILKDSIFFTPQLEILELNYNGIYEIDNFNWGILKNLKVFHIYYNQFTHLPFNLIYLLKLENLHIGSTITDENWYIICELRNLRVLDLAYCKFTKIPCEIRKLKKLEKLSFFGITSLEYDNICWDCLYELENLQEVLFTEIPESLQYQLENREEYSRLKKIIKQRK